jgi:hypothetical protein
MDHQEMQVQVEHLNLQIRSSSKFQKWVQMDHLGQVVPYQEIAGFQKWNIWCKWSSEVQDPSGTSGQMRSSGSSGANG